MGQCFSSYFVAMCLQSTFFITQTYGADYNAYSSLNKFTCTLAGKNDTCTLHCDEEKKTGYIFDCGNADHCVFQCESKQCLQDGILNASNALYDLTVISSASQCLKTATINTPNFGDATFSMSEEKSFKEMTVNSGTNTKNIIIDCTFGNGDECKEMQVNAQNAQYLEIMIGAFSEYVGDVTNGIRAQINCPQNSNYNGPEMAPCFIDVSAGGLLSYVSINALDGIPTDVWIETGSITLNNVVITCTNGQTYNSGNGFLESGNPCWNDGSSTITTTTTITPTIAPLTQYHTSNTMESMAYKYEYDIISSFYLVLVIVIFLSILFLVTMTVNIQKRIPENKWCLKLFYPADDCYTFALVMFALQFWDFVSDINFSYATYHRYQYTEYHNIPNGDEYKESLYLYAYLSALFVIMPWIANLLFLAFMRKVWSINGRCSSWLRDYAVFLVLLTMITGGANASVYLCNCRIFGYSIFEMGLPKRMILQTSRFRVLLVTVIENIPQLCIQMLYVTLTKQWEMALIIACLSSSFSIILTFSAVVLQCGDNVDDKVVEVRVLPSTKDMSNKFHLQKMCHLRNKTADSISGAINFDPIIVEVENIFIGHNNLRIIVAINDNMDHLSILSLFQSAKDDRSLAESVQNALRLEDIPSIESVQIFMSDELVSNIDQQIASRQKSKANAVSLDAKKVTTMSAGNNTMQNTMQHQTFDINLNQQIQSKSISDVKQLKITKPQKQNKIKKEKDRNDEDSPLTPMMYAMNALELNEIQQAFKPIVLKDVPSNRQKNKNRKLQSMTPMRNTYENRKSVQNRKNKNGKSGSMTPMKNKERRKKIKTIQSKKHNRKKNKKANSMVPLTSSQRKKQKQSYSNKRHDDT